MSRITESRAVNWVGHRWWIVIVLMAGISGPSVYLPLYLWALSWLPVAAWLYCSIQHDKRLCETCIAHWPLNSPDLAQRKHKALWLAHRSHWVSIAVGVVVAFSPGPWLVRSLALPLYMALHYRSMVIHGQLGPWCPYCQGGGGGGEDEAVTPTPSPQGVAS